MLRSTNKDYKYQKPTTARLIVEIAVSLLSYDREKARVYAKGNVEEYWIVDIYTKIVEVHCLPEGCTYTEKKIYSATDKISIFRKEISLKEIFE